MRSLRGKSKFYNGGKYIFRKFVFPLIICPKKLSKKLNEDEAFVQPFRELPSASRVASSSKGNSQSMYDSRTEGGRPKARFCCGQVLVKHRRGHNTRKIVLPKKVPRKVLSDVPQSSNPYSTSRYHDLRCYFIRDKNRVQTRRTHEDQARYEIR